MMGNLTKISAIAALAALAFGLGACNHATKINLSTYEPVIDLGAHNKTKAQYEADLSACRALARRVEASYLAQRKREQDQAIQRAIIGAAIGGIAGAAIGDSGSKERRAAAVGAATGASIGAASAPVDMTRAMAKFGAPGVVDECMHGRDYRILNYKGFGTN